MNDDPAVSLSVLIVEDFLDSAESLAEVLSLHGHQVRIAGSGTEALQEAATATLDVVLLDIGLPGMNGWELAVRLKELAKPPVLIALTAFGRDEDLRRSEEAGIHLHLVKPVNPATLVGLLKRVARMVQYTSDSSRGFTGFTPGHPADAPSGDWKLKAGAGSSLAPGEGDRT